MAALEGEVPAEPSARPIDRRILLKGAAVALGAVGVAAIGAPRVANATTGAMQFGATNDAASDEITLQSSAANTLHLKTSNASSRGLLVESANNATAPAVSVLMSGSGAGEGVEIKRPDSSAGNMLYIEKGQRERSTPISLIPEC